MRGNFGNFSDNNFTIQRLPYKKVKITSKFSGASIIANVLFDEDFIVLNSNFNLIFPTPVSIESVKFGGLATVAK